MKKFQRSVCVVALFVVVFSACKDDDDSGSCKNGAFEITINGENFEATSFENTLFKGNSGGIDGKRMDIRATEAGGAQIVITFTDLSTGTSGDCMSTDEYIPFADIETGLENTVLFTVYENETTYSSFIEGTLDITSCDADAKQVSGTFSFYHEDEEVEAEGSFTNMCYRVIQQ